MKAPLGVLFDLELSATSSLMADRYKPGSRGAIKRIHSINSIFHLLLKIKNYRIREKQFVQNNSQILPFLINIVLDPDGHSS